MRPLGNALISVSVAPAVTLPISVAMVTLNQSYTEAGACPPPCSQSERNEQDHASVTLLFLLQHALLRHHGDIGPYLHPRGRAGSCWGRSSSGLLQWRSCHRGWLGSGCRSQCPFLSLSSGTCSASPRPSAFPVQLRRKHMQLYLEQQSPNLFL